MGCKKYLSLIGIHDDDSLVERLSKLCRFTTLSGLLTFKFGVVNHSLPPFFNQHSCITNGYID